MLPDLNELRIKRKHLNLTQKELADLSNVSQSLIAKIESGKLVPSYENAKRVFDVLDGVHQKKVLRAKEIMTKNVISIHKNETVKKAIYLMNKYSISQIPVIENKVSIGTISEAKIVDKIYEEKIGDPKKAEVKDVMDSSLPLVDENSPIQVISVLLEHHNGILVQKHGFIKGIITRTDLLKSII